MFFSFLLALQDAGKSLFTMSSCSPVDPRCSVIRRHVGSFECIALYFLSVTFHRISCFSRVEDVLSVGVHVGAERRGAEGKARAIANQTKFSDARKCKKQGRKA